MGAEISGRRIAYVQFTNPGAYPPLEHSSRILADRGWEVLFLGTGSRGSADLAFSPHPRIKVELLPFVKPGLAQKIGFVRFASWALHRCRNFRPDWIYASDALSTTAALVVSEMLRCPIIYHEHDAPGVNAGAFHRAIRWCRSVVARRARLCVVPNESRRLRFQEEHPTANTACVWNCPGRGEIPEPKQVGTGGTLRAYFHGNLGIDYTPRSLFEAFGDLGGDFSLTIRGYDVSGGGRDVDRIRADCRSLRIDSSVRLLPPVPTRAELWHELQNADVGLAIFPMTPRNFNVRHLAGASNKIFDYLAAGVPVIVPDVEEWRDLVVRPGYALSCDTSRPESIVEALRWCAGNRAALRAMGEAGRKRILEDWNYEAQFEPVVRILEG